MSLEVKRGEVVGVIGRNGAGKSTLLKIPSRITESTSGRAEIYGRMASLLEVGTGFDPELTGRENVYFSGAVVGMRGKTSVGGSTRSLLFRAPPRRSAGGAATSPSKENASIVSKI